MKQKKLECQDVSSANRDARAARYSLSRNLSCTEKHGVRVLGEHQVNDSGLGHPGQLDLGFAACLQRGGRVESARRLDTNRDGTHDGMMKAIGVQDRLERIAGPVVCPLDDLATLQSRTLGSIKNEMGCEWQLRQALASHEQSSEFRVLGLPVTGLRSTDPIAINQIKIEKGENNDSGTQKAHLASIPTHRVRSPRTFSRKPSFIAR